MDVLQIRTSRTGKLDLLFFFCVLLIQRFTSVLFWFGFQALGSSTKSLGSRLSNTRWLSSSTFFGGRGRPILLILVADSQVLPVLWCAGFRIFRIASSDFQIFKLNVRFLNSSGSSNAGVTESRRLSGALQESKLFELLESFSILKKENIPLNSTKWCPNSDVNVSLWKFMKICL